jgi:hypothetical protein
MPAHRGRAQPEAVSVPTENAGMAAMSLAGNGHCTVLPARYGISADRGSDAPRRARSRGAANPPAVTISQGGKLVAALINIDDLADLEDRAAPAAHLADKAAGRAEIGLDELDAALDRIDAESSS